MATVVGTPVDVDQVELLFVSLLIQSTRAMAEAGTAQPGSFDRSPRFRRSFLTSYAVRIGERLSAADAETTASYGSELVPVLRRQEEVVDAVYERLFPHTSESTRTGPTTGGAGTRDVRPPIGPVSWRAGSPADGDGPVGAQGTRSKTSGSGPVRSSRFRALIAAMSSSVSSKSNSAKFSWTLGCGHRLREHDVAPLQVPAQRHLGRRAPDPLERSRRWSGRPAPRPGRSATTPRWRCRARRRTRAPSSLVEIRVHLDLVDRRHDGALRGQPVEVVGLEVGDADGSRPAARVDLLHRLPRLDEVA